MKIAIIGYGKMGHMIENVALSRGHEVVCVVDPIVGSRGSLNDADVAIEFSTPGTAEQNIHLAWEAGLPVVCGSTGWDTTAIMQQADREGKGLMWSSNFSLGVNLFFKLNKCLAELMHPYPYTPTITETHHIHKLDKPSGTAKTLAEAIAPDVVINSIREGEVPGIHTIRWESEVDSIEITHNAKSRQGFALGAVIAAEWMQGKTGLHSMEEVLTINK